MRIGDLIAATRKPFFSLEFFPPGDEAKLPEFYATAEKLGRLKPLFVSVTYGAGGARQRNTLHVTEELARRGFTVMAHLTCVGADPESISDFLRQLEERGVDNVLALRGDPPRDRPWDWKEGYFRYAVDLVRFIRREFPQMGVGVAAYPTPHPESPTFEEDRSHTAEKMAAGAQFAITQLFFDVREYVDLLHNLRQHGLTTPVVPGILPIQSLESLRRVLSLCGATIPAKFYLELENAHASGGSEAVLEAGIEFAFKQIRQLLAAGAPGIHLYTLNKSALCERLIRECGLFAAGEEAGGVEQEMRASEAKDFLTKI